MARNNTATTVTELINELEALNDILCYIDICEKDARQNFKDYTARFAETTDEYWNREACVQSTKAKAFLKYKKMLIDWAIK